MSEKDHPAPRIVVTKDGPYLVSGGLKLVEKIIVTNEALAKLAERLA